MTIRWLMAGVAAALIVSSPSFAQDKASQKFLKEAIEGNLAEVQMGELAQKNGKSDKVRSFGQMLQKDHSDANQKATAAANQLGMSPPTEPNRKQKAMYGRMSELSGDNFDREFAKHMVEDHKKDIKAYEKEAKKNDAAAAYAKEALPPCTSIWRRRSHSAARLRAQDPEASCWQTRLEQRRIDVS